MTGKPKSNSTKKPGTLSWIAEKLNVGDRKESRINWLLFSVSAFAVSAAIALMILTVAGFFLFFGRFNKPFLGSPNIDDWVKFSSFFGFVSQTIVGAATLLGALFVAFVVTRRAERQRKRDQNTQELLRLSEKLVDTDFYVKIVFPSWEVALRWFEEDNHLYRAEVVRGEFRFPVRYDGNRAGAMLAEPILRRHPHFLPYDRPDPVSGEKEVVGELSESLALATWIRFWRNVAFLIERKLLDPDDARSMLREWYMWWAPFMTELMAVCGHIEREFGPFTIYPDETSFADLRKLHKVFDISPFCGSARSGEFDVRIRKLVKGMKPYLPDLQGDNRINSQL